MLGAEEELREADRLRQRAVAELENSMAKSLLRIAAVYV
jgi:hypothetical protein